MKGELQYPVPTTAHTLRATSVSTATMSELAVVVVERPERAPQRVPEQHEPPDEHVGLVDLPDGHDDEPDGQRAPTDAGDQGPERGQPVGRGQLHVGHPGRPAGAQRAHGRQRFGARGVAVNRTACGLGSVR